MQDPMTALGVGIVLLTSPLLLIRWALGALRDFIAAAAPEPKEDDDADA